MVAEPLDVDQIALARWSLISDVVGGPGVLDVVAVDRDRADRVAGGDGAVDGQPAEGAVSAEHGRLGSMVIRPAMVPLTTSMPSATVVVPV